MTAWPLAFPFLGGLLIGLGHLLMKRLATALPPITEPVPFIIAAFLSPLSYIVVAASLAGTVLYVVGLQRAPLSAVAIVFLSTVSFTILLLDAAVNRSSLSWLEWAGIICCIAGMLLLSQR